MKCALLLLAFTGSLLAQEPQEKKPDEKVTRTKTESGNDGTKDKPPARYADDKYSIPIIGWWGALAGGVAGVVVGLINLRIAALQRKQLAAQHFREIALKAAQIEWEHALASASAWRDPMDESERPTVEPLDYFIVRKLKLMQTFDDKNLTPELLRSKVKDLAEFNASFSQQTQRQK